MAGMTVAELVARLRADTGHFSRGMRMAESELGRLDRTVTGVTLGMARMGQTADQMLQGISLAAGAAVASLAAVGVSYNTLMQRTTAAFSVLLGSAENANKMVGELTEFARSSPFPRQLFIAGAQQLIGFGLAAQRVVPAFQAIQDAVAAVGGTAEDISQFTNIFARIQSLGHANSEELMRFSMVGIDAFKLLAEQAGVSVEEMRKRVHDGALGSNEAIALLTEGLETKFGGAAAKVKQTWVGATDRIKGAWRDIGSHLMAPFIDPQGGGAAVKWANQLADLLRKLETQVVKPLAARMDQFFERIQAHTDKINFDDWLQRGVDLWNKYQDVLKQVLPIMGLVGLSFAKSGLSAIPFFGQLANFLPIPGKLVMAFAGLILANKEFRDLVVDLAQSIGARVAPVLKEFGTALLHAGQQVGALLAHIAPGVITQLADALVTLIEAGAALVPVLADVVSVGLIGIAQIAPPVIAGLAQMVKWAAQLTAWLGPLGSVLIIAGLALVRLPGPLGLVNRGFAAFLPLAQKAWALLAAHPLLAVAAAAVYFAIRISGGFEGLVDNVQAVGTAFMILPRIVSAVLQGILATVTNFGEAISMALHDALNPFIRHSPSLVDQVIAGTDVIAARYNGLAASIIPRMRSIEKAMGSLNAAAAVPEIRLKATKNDEVAKQIALFGGPGLLAAYHQMSAEIATLDRELAPLIERYKQENDLLNEQQKHLDELNKGYREYQVSMRVTQRAVEDASRIVDDLARRIGKAQESITRILNTPLKGSSAFSDAQFANEQAIAALQYRLNRLKMTDGPIDEMAELEEKINRLRMVGDQLRLEEQLSLGPQRRELEKLSNTVEEISFDDAVDGIKEAADEIRNLTKQLSPAEDELNALKDVLAGQEQVALTWQRAIEDASSNIDRQTDVVQELGTAIGGVQSIMEAYGERQAEIAAAAAENWAEVMRAAKEAAGAAEIEATIPHDLTGMGDAGAAAVGTLLDGIEKEMSEFDTSAFTEKFEEMGRTVSMAFGYIADGFGLLLGVRGVGGILSKVGGGLSTLGTAMSGPAGIAGVALGTGVAFTVMSKNASDAADDVTYAFEAMPKASTWRDYATNFEMLNGQYEGLKSNSEGIWKDVAAAAQNALPMVDNTIDRSRAAALGYEERLGSMQATMQVVSDTADKLAGKYNVNANELRDLAVVMGVVDQDAATAEQQMYNIVTSLDSMGISAKDASKLVPESLAAIVQGSTNFRAQMEENLQNSTSLWGLFGGQTELTADQMREQLEKMSADAQAWGQYMNVLAREGPGVGITQAMLDELASAGPKSLPLARSLVESINNGSIAEITGSLTSYEEAWRSTGKTVEAARPVMAFAADQNSKVVVEKVLAAARNAIPHHTTAWQNLAHTADQFSIFANAGQVGSMMFTAEILKANEKGKGLLAVSFLGLGAVGSQNFSLGGWNAGVSWVSQVISALTNPANQQAIKHAMKAVMQMGSLSISLAVPPTADGGIFSGAQLRLIGEAGPEAVLPLNDFSRSMQLLSEAGMLPRIAASLFGSVMGSTVASGGASFDAATLSSGGTGGRPASNTTVVNVTVQGNVTSERNLVEAIHAGLIAKGKRNNNQVYFERVNA